MRTTRDGDLDAERIEAARTADLANGLGNLVGRVTALVTRVCAGAVPALGDADDLDSELIATAALLPRRIDARSSDLRSTWIDSPGRANRLAVLIRTLRVIASELEPFLPATSRAIVERVAASRVRHGPPLFPR